MADNTLNIILNGKNNTGGMFQQVRADMDAIARRAKAAPLEVPVTVDTTQAKARIAELQRQIATLQQRARAGTITVLDMGQLSKAKAELAGLQSAFAGVETQANGLASVVGGKLAGAFTVAAVAAGAFKAAQIAAELGQLGAQSIVTERSFNNVLNSIGVAPALLNDLKRAAGGTISEMRLMQLTNTALAGASDELGQSFANAIPKLIEGARAANQLNPALGTTEFLFQSLVTGIKRGSPLLIDNTGITLKLGEANAAYAASLGKSVEALTEEEQKQALLNETLRGVDRLMEQVGGSLDNETAKLQAMSVATEELRTELGKLIAKPYVVVVEMLTKGVSAATARVGDIELTQTANDIQQTAEARIEAIDALIDRLREQQAEVRALGEMPNSQAALAQADAEIKSLQNRAAMLRVYGNAADVVQAQLENLNAAARDLAAAQENANAAAAQGTDFAKGLTQAELATAQAAYAAAEAALQTAVGVARMAQEADNSTSSMLGLAQAIRETTAAAALLSTRNASPWDFTSASAMDAYAEAMRGDTQARAGERYAEQQRKALEAAQAQAARDAAKSAKTAASAWNSEFEQVASRIQGYLSRGMSNAKGLLDLGGDMFKPGANGAFENIYRALDVAKLGDASPWAAALGMTQEDAKKISEDFQRGIFSEGVMGLIDQDALVNEAQMAALAEKSQAAFVKAIAAKAGVGGGVVNAMLGFGGAAQGEQGQKTQGQAAIDSAMSQVAGALGDSVKDAAFAKKITGYGEMIGGFLEDGIVAWAKASQALKNAFETMARNAIAGQTGGSVSGAARAGGVQ